MTRCDFLPGQTKNDTFCSGVLIVLLTFVGNAQKPNQFSKMPAIAVEHREAMRLGGIQINLTIQIKVSKLTKKYKFDS